MWADWCAGWWTGECAAPSANTSLDEATLSAESDKSPGVLLASGYIAGGAIAGIIIAVMAGALRQPGRARDQVGQTFNPFYAGPNADWLALIPFAALAGVLYLTAQQKAWNRA